MKKICLFFLLFTFFFSMHSQNAKTQSNSVKRYYYRDSVLSMARWKNNKKALDSIKTYYKSGELDEAFYYSNNKLNGASYKYNKAGETAVTWQFKNGKLVERIDHIIIFNKKNEEKIKNSHKRLKEINAKLLLNPNELRSIYSRAHIRSYLGNRMLSLRDFAYVRRRLSKISKKNPSASLNKMLGNVYDATGGIYSSWEMENHATHYRYKAVKADPGNNRLVFNLGAYLSTIKSYELSKHYLNKSLKASPRHAFTHRALATLHSDFEDYEKAKYHIDIAFPREKNLLKYGYGALERDIRTLRGFISHNLDNSESGIIDLKEAIELNENNSFAHRNIGVVYYDLGKYILACEHLQKAKSLGYEKIHDRDNLQAYLELSCENATIIENNKNNQTEVVIEAEPIQISKLSDKPFIYPNPTKGDIHIKNLPFKDYQYQVFDFTGKLVFQGASQKTPINISQLSSGVYILKAIKNDLVETFRVIKD